MMNKEFFDEITQQSRVKLAIVSKYFKVWATVVMSVQDRESRTSDKKIAYIDLFSGPGQYSDGTPSTPLRVLQIAIKNEKIRKRLVTFFNDKNEEYVKSLQDAIQQLPELDALEYPPVVKNHDIGEGIGADIVKILGGRDSVPTLLFIDPWGYKGLSLRLIEPVVQNWGCDCIFFFNYNRINMGLNNPIVKNHMDALFGEGRADKLRVELSKINSAQRELKIVEKLCEAFQEMGPEYVLPFRFKDDRGTRASHHLIFVSKNFKGYEIMKDIMAKESSGAEQGVASFEYNPVDKHMKQGLLFQLACPLDDLGDMLLKEFAGKTIAMRKIYELHSVNRPYTKPNYKTVLTQLEQQQKIKASTHRRGTFGDSVVVTFPLLKRDSR